VSEADLSTKKGRVGKGYKLAVSSEKTGKIVFGGVLHKDNELFVTTSGGKSIRMSASDIREVGRGSKGVKVQKMSKGEHIVAAAKIEVNGD
jgi:DNA gyrase subunit A